jgi:disulfide bond formation protein DsbB
MSEQPTPPPDDSTFLIPALFLFGGITLILVILFSGKPSQKPGTAVAVQPTAASVATTAPTQPVNIVVPTTQKVADAAALDPVKVKAGGNIFQTVCAACHGFNAKGISGLGKPLVGSVFVNGLNDDELLAFVIKGRAVGDPLNTSGVAMPARGGNPSLKDDDLRNVVAYIRSLNGGKAAAVASSPAAQSATATPAPTSVPTIVPTLEPGFVTATPSQGGGNLFGSSGQSAYLWACASCHGADGSGVTYFGPALSTSKLLKARDGFGLLKFLSAAKPPVNPGEAFPHPYRGGYPELSDAQIQALIAYLYTLPGAR